MAFIASNYGMVHGISKAWAPEMKNAKLETLGYFRNMWFWTWKLSTWVREWVKSSKAQHILWVIHILAVSSGASASWMDPEPRFQHENLLGSRLSDHGPLWYGHDPHAGLCSMAVTSDGSSESNGAGMTNKVMGCIPMYNLSLLNRFSFWKTQTQWIFSFPKRCNVPESSSRSPSGIEFPEDMPENGFLDFMEWTTRLFWTFDSRWQQKTGEIFFGVQPEDPTNRNWKKRPSYKDSFMGVNINININIIINLNIIYYNININII